MFCRAGAAREVEDFMMFALIELEGAHEFLVWVSPDRSWLNAFHDKFEYVCGRVMVIRERSRVPGEL